METPVTHRLLVVRTGETEWDLADRVQGSTDLPLSAAGRKRLESQMAELGKPPISAVFSATDEASLTTAQMLGSLAGAKVVPLPALREMSFGLWEGILRSELEDRFCRAGRVWGDDPQCITPPEGESLASFVSRLLPTLRKSLGRIRPVRTRRSLMTKPAAAIVLRPIGDAVLRCMLRGLPANSLPEAIRERPAPAWFDVDLNRGWELPNRPRPVTAASAA